MSSRYSDPQNTYLQCSENGNTSDSLSLQDCEQDSRLSLSSLCSRRSSHIGSSRRSSLVKPPRCSLCQGPFFRIRDYGKPLYPSECYAIPEVGALDTLSVVNRAKPIVFIGTDVATFNESDPPKQYKFEGTKTCDEFDACKRRTSIIVMESAETKRNDEILSLLDMSDEESDNDFSGRRSIADSSTENTIPDPVIPVGNLRNYLKRKEEIDRINQTYLAEWEKQMETEVESDDMDVESDDSIIASQSSVILGQMDSLVEYNNTMNKRLSTCDDSVMMNASYSVGHLLSPRLSKVVAEPEEPQEQSVPIECDSLDDGGSYLRMRLERIQKEIECFPASETFSEVTDSLGHILEKKDFVCELNNAVRMIWDNDMSIDSYQSDMNQQEEIFGLKELEERMLNNETPDCLEIMENEMREYIRFHAMLLGWNASSPSPNLLCLEYPLEQGSFYLDINCANGVMLGVNVHNTIHNDSMQDMLHHLIHHYIRRQYRCYELYGLLQKLSNDLYCIQQDWKNHQ